MGALTLAAVSLAASSTFGVGVSGVSVGAGVAEAMDCAVLAGKTVGVSDGSGVLVGKIAGVSDGDGVLAGKIVGVSDGGGVSVWTLAVSEGGLAGAGGADAS